jgi:hypothetical protein
MREAGLAPDRWQAAVLRSHAPRMMLNCSRQAGKSSVAAAVALLTALREAPALVLLLSPSLRQSEELYRKTRGLYDALPCPVATARATGVELELANGSRVVSLPGTEGTIRGYSGVALLVVDEAARVSDALYCAVRPMLAVSQGRLLALSTPFGRRGWFYDEWTGGQGWERVRIPADQCPRIPREFLDQERRAIGDRWFRQEYGCEFQEMIGAVFSGADIEAALSVPVPARPFPE